MKKILCAALAVMMLVLLAGCARGNVAEAEYVIEPGDGYSEAAVTAAMDRVTSFFKAEFKGCSLLTLSYNGQQAEEADKAWAQELGYEQAIVIDISFRVDEPGTEINLDPGVYDHYSFVLARNGEAAWQIKTLGFV